MGNQPQVSIEIVTPELASLMLANSRYEHQRQIKTSHVSYLAAEMEDGSFKQDTVIEFCVVNGVEWLTDGQHRLSAIVWSKRPQRFVIVRRTMDSEESVAVDYTRTDKGRRRTIAEDYKTLDLHNELGLTWTQIQLVGPAIQLIAAGFRRSAGAMHSKPRLALIREYGDAAGDFFEASAGALREIRSRMDRRASLAVALVTFRYSVAEYGNKVESFWNGIALDDGLKANDPRKFVVRHLLDRPMVGGPSTSAKAVTVSYSSRFIARCFNAWVADEEVRQIKVMDSASSIVISGSPFDGKS